MGTNNDKHTAFSRRDFITLGSAAAIAAAGGAALAGCTPGGSSSGKAKTGEAARLTPGTYEATAPGFIDDITAAVTMSENAIEDIEITSSHETTSVGSLGLATLRDRILQYQTVNVDTLSGATVSSMALQSIVSDTLKQAGADKKDFSEEVHINYAGPEAKDVETKVVIAGGGCAGMVTAIRIARKGVPVILVDKRAMFGGTSSRAGYQLFGAGSRTQKESPDVPYKTADDFYNQYIYYDSMGVIDHDMERMRSDGMGELIDWVRFDIGVPLDRSEPGGLAVIMNKDELAKGRKWGGVFTECLLKEMDRLGIDRRLETRAVEILMKDGKAAGLKVESPNGSYNINAEATVIATGAFASNPEMVAKYLPEWTGLPSNEVPEATGDGIQMGQKVGAALKGMDDAHLVLYTSCVKISDTQTLPVSIRSGGGIVVNKNGKRFHDELDMQLVNLAVAVKEQPEQRYFGVVDQAWIDEKGAVKNAVSADTIAELAEKIGVDPAGLEAEVKHYNEMYEAGKDTDFNRLTINYPVSTPPFWGTELYTGHHGFDGGLEVDHRMQVKKEDGTPFPGLYAGGGGVEFGLATVSAMSGKIFTAALLADTLLEDLGYNS